MRSFSGDIIARSALPEIVTSALFFFLSSFSSGNIIAVMYQADGLANKSLQFIIVIVGLTVSPGYLLLLRRADKGNIRIASSYFVAGSQGQHLY